MTPVDFTTFMRNYQDMVYSTAVRLLGNDTHAEDISQEVFLKAYERYDDLGSSPTAGGLVKDRHDESIHQSLATVPEALALLFRLGESR